MSTHNKTYDPSKGEMPPINIKGQVGRVKPQKSLWQKAKEKAQAAIGEIPLGFKPRTGGEVNKVKDVRR